MKTYMAKLRLILTMSLFGTIGLFARYLHMPSGMVALVRGAVGMLVLLLIMALMRKRPSLAAIRKNLPVLLLSGLFLGVNWILLFESYRYTTVSTATLCYYTAPIFVVLGASLFFRETLTVRKLLCILLALLGMVGVSGVPEDGLPAAGEARGIFLGLSAAVFYAGIILLNKRLSSIDSYDKTFFQLGTAALVLLPYTLLVEGGFAFSSLSLPALLHLLFLGVVHTGIAYYLYFGAMAQLPSQTVAIFSYVDPVVAVLLSVFVLREDMTFFRLLGAVFVLLAAVVSELFEEKGKKL